MDASTICLKPKFWVIWMSTLVVILLLQVKTGESHYYNKSCSTSISCSEYSTYLKCIGNRCQCDSNSHYDPLSKKCRLNKDVKCQLAKGHVGSAGTWQYGGNQPCARHSECKIPNELKMIKLDFGFCECFYDSRHRHDGTCSSGHSAVFDFRTIFSPILVIVTILWQH